MERVKDAKGNTLKLPGKSGPFCFGNLTTEEATSFGARVAEGGYPAHEQFRDLVQMALCYEKSGRRVYSPQQKGKMEKDLGGFAIVRLAQQAMEHYGLIGEESFGEKVERAEKN